ncbi:MAG TPA: hypothetical protein VHN80_08575, partial [Kineosporiaceae bacterium]|nr:hypothetical protein [Kineosporiaceae bacterium]
SFNVTVPAPAVSTTPASVSPTGATLNGSVTPNGAATTVTFLYGTTSPPATPVTADQSPVPGSAGATAVSKAVTGLAPGTVHYFRARANNGTGGDQLGTVLSFTTPAPAGPTITTTSPLPAGTIKGRVAEASSTCSQRIPTGL